MAIRSPFHTAILIFLSIVAVSLSACRDENVPVANRSTQSHQLETPVSTNELPKAKFKQPEFADTKGALEDPEISPSLIEDVRSGDELFPPEALSRILERRGVKARKRTALVPRQLLIKIDWKNYAAIRLHVSTESYQQDKSSSKEYCESIGGKFREVSDLGEEAHSCAYKEDPDYGGADNKIVSFSRAKYLIVLTSISRDDDKGHLADNERLLELAKLVDKQILNRK